MARLTFLFFALAINALCVFATPIDNRQLIITTPEQNEQFESGFFEANPYVVVTFEESAHENVLALPSLYAYTNYGTLIFNKGKSSVRLMPQFRGVEAHYFEGNGVTVGLPSLYQRYFITFTDAVMITEDDIDHILLWTNAQIIVIHGGDDIAYELMLRENALSELSLLEHLELSVQRLSHAKLKVQTFLDALPSLKTITFNVAALNIEEKGEFIANQGALQPTKFIANEVVYKK